MPSLWEHQHRAEQESSCSIPSGDVTLAVTSATMRFNNYCIILFASLTSTLSTAQTIRSYAALGDSYPAGDGAGSSRLLPHLDATCGRFSEAYPVQIAETLGLTNHWFHPHFQNVACSGATTKTVIWHQLHHILGADLITIQVGGNEVDFFPLLNEYVQQWHPLSSCDRELNRAKKALQSIDFMERFDRMVKLTTRLKKRDARLLVLGYARFFDAETSQCNSVSFSVTNPVNVLSNELRRSLNELVVMLNDVIRGSAEAHGAVYVDIDALFEGHRFCEEGVVEPRPDGEGTWFFREDPARNRQMHEQSLSPTHGSEQQRVLAHPLSRFAGLTRTFHPTIEGHAAIAEKIEQITR